MRTIDGRVTIVQESRFQLVDDLGVGHHVTLGHASLVEPDQLEQLAARQCRVRVSTTEAPDVIGLVAHDVSPL